MRRAIKYFFKPSQVNVAKVPKLAVLGQRMGLLYPRRGPSPLVLDNRKMDGFIDRFLDTSCIDVDCETCRYCHRFADEALTIDPEYRRDVLEQYRALFEDMHQGSFWEHPRLGDLVDAGRLAANYLRKRRSKGKDADLAAE